MTTHELIQRVRIYLSERDTSEGRPLYLLVMERLQREGATGATALRGVAGFGPGHRLQTAGPADLSRATPILIEWVDRAERVARVLPLLDDLLPDALITLEDLHVHRAALRSSGRFGERSVGEVVARDVVVAHPAMLLREVVARMLERGQARIPVIDAQGRVAGMIGDEDLARRGGLALPLRVLRALDPAERAALLDALPPRTAADVMATDARTLYAEASIPQAVGTLVEWGLDLLPVTEREGQLAGLFGVEQALGAALDQRRPAGGPVRDAEPPTPVQLVMQRAMPQIAPATPLADALAQLLAAPDRFLLVVDGGRPVGVLADDQLLGRLAGPARAVWLAALQSPESPLAAQLADAEQPSAGELAAPAPTIGAQATQDDATRLMLEQGHERLMVADDDGRLVGMLSRRSLLRALAQESVG